jgi:3D (Asp-Asp-Asp) domain-containing protein
MDRQVKKTVIIVFSAVMFFLITAGGLYYYLSSTKKEVTVLSEYNKYSAVVYGNADVSKVLARAGISLRPGDILYASLSDPVADGAVIYINYEETEETLWSASSAADTANYVAPNIITTPVGTYYYYKEIEVEATGYCSCPICCGPYDGSTTASGTTPTANHTIAASSDYPFGTTVYIPYFASGSNGGIFVVEDRGSAIQNNCIDVYFNTHEEALQFGRRTLIMYVLDTTTQGI